MTWIETLPPAPKATMDEVIRKSVQGCISKTSGGQGGGACSLL